ncbi:hypothetical protein KSP40_PGU020537 [Platanthera guangdongensis]|uniref:Uncharacterized protein n=1 Tax=Platanthera guangdongensis TaxID=2320717 RepID=A0ABR2LYJ8_9ASPA
MHALVRGRHALPVYSSARRSRHVAGLKNLRCRRIGRPIGPRLLLIDKFVVLWCIIIWTLFPVFLPTVILSPPPPAPRWHPTRSLIGRQLGRHGASLTAHRGLLQRVTNFKISRQNMAPNYMLSPPNLPFKLLDRNERGLHTFQSS